MGSSLARSNQGLLAMKIPLGCEGYGGVVFEALERSAIGEKATFAGAKFPREIAPKTIRPGHKSAPPAKPEDFAVQPQKPKEERVFPVGGAPKSGEGCFHCPGVGFFRAFAGFLGRFGGCRFGHGLVRGH